MKEVSLFRIITANKQRENDRNRLPYSVVMTMTKEEKTTFVPFDGSAYNHICRNL